MEEFTDVVKVGRSYMKVKSPALGRKKLQTLQPTVLGDKARRDFNTIILYPRAGIGNPAPGKHFYEFIL